MRILVVGSGGREHALVAKLSQEAEVFCAPGNPGILAECPCFSVDPCDSAEVVALALRLRVDLVVVGPEAPLILGLGDALTGAGIPSFGPVARAARLEGSKAFAKELMAQSGIPTARFETFSDSKLAIEFARRMVDEGAMPVVKASGEALGKGVVVCSSFEEAVVAIREAMVNRAFGDAGQSVVIEERLPGPEFSLMSLCSDRRFVSMPIAQDHKRAFDGDRGPNTGGMGSYSPVAWVGQELTRQTEERVVQPALDAMSRLGVTYRGTLFSGLMMGASGIPECLEFNVRFGDPETQSVLARVGNGFAAALLQCATGGEIEGPEILDLAAVTVVIAGPGYPAESRKGIPIEIGTMPPDVKLFHAGTRMANGCLETAGGRVFGVTATATSVDSARALAYEGVRQVRFDGAQFRTDIAATA